MVVRVRIAEAGPYAFLLDTGTTPSIVDAALAKRLGLRAVGPAGHGTDVGATQTGTAYPVTIRDLRIGALREERLDAIALDVSTIGERLGIPLGGVLGSNFFDGRVVRIDYPCRTVSVSKDAPPIPFTARFHELASGEIVTNDVRVGSQGVTATIDTGDNGEPIVTALGIRALHLQATARAGKRTSSESYGGRHVETLGVLHDVRLGSRSFGTLDVRFLPSADSPFAINIGNRPLRQFVVTLDYERGRLTLGARRACANGRGRRSTR